MTDSGPDDARSVELAGVLHDTAVQHGTAALLTVELATLHADLPPRVRELLGEAEVSLREAVQAMRSVMHQLDPHGLHTRSHTTRAD